MQNDSNSEVTKWDKVYENSPETLPWYGKQFPPEVNDFFTKLSKDAPVLVTGCGAGDTANSLKEKGFLSVYGTDISRKAIQVAKQRFSNVEFEVLPTQLVSREKKYDGVNVFDWLNMHQVSQDDVVPYLQSLANISQNLCIVWIFERGKGVAQKSFVHEGSIYFHSPDTVKALLGSKLTFVSEFEFSFSSNPQAKEARTFNAVGQVYKMGSQL